MSAAAIRAQAAEPNDWVRPVSLGVTACLIVWCFSGWMMDKGPTLEGWLLAALTGVFQALGFNASAQMRRASVRNLRRARLFWIYVLAITSGWTAFAAHHAYSVIAGEPPAFAWTVEGVGGFIESAAALVLLGAAATIDPLLGWAIEEVERTPLPAPARIERAEPANDAAPSASSAPRRRYARAAAAGGVAMLALASQSTAAAYQRAPEAFARELSGDEREAAEAKALAMLMERDLVTGARLHGSRSIAKATGLSRHRVVQLEKQGATVAA